MAPERSQKRRKLSHSSQQDSHDDDGSFASFGSSDGEPDQEPSRESQVPSKPSRTKPVINGAAARPKPIVKDRNAAAALAGASYKSNFFKLQVDELLAEIRPQQKKRETSAESVLHKLKSDIETLPSRSPKSVHDAERELITKSHVAVPFPNPRPASDAQYKLQYAPPASINVIGSHALKTRTKTAHTLSIDMLLTMPKSIFDDKDYLNHRYYHKRAYYLACIAAGLRKSLDSKELTLNFETLHDDLLKPILVITPVRPNGDIKSTSSSWRIILIVGASYQTFKADKLLPRKNALREHVDQTSHEPIPTPFYNSSLQADCLYTAYLKALHTAKTTCAGFTDACLLANVWLDQRGHTSSLTAGGFGHFEFAAIIAVLLRTGATNGKPVLSAAYTSYQLFKATIQYLATRDMVKQPVVLDADRSVISTQSETPIFFDGSRSHNILYKMSASSYKLLHADAKSAMATLADTSADAFEATFITKVDRPHLRHDTFVTLSFDKLGLQPTQDHQFGCGSSDKLYKILTRGLGDRVSLVAIKITPLPAWEVGSARASHLQNTVCTIALTLDPANASRLVDHGPSAENKVEAAEFRDFWGEKAELRRFQDGSILESLVWSRKEDPAPVVEQIVKHLLARHFGGPARDGARFSTPGVAYEVRPDVGAKHQLALDAYKRFETDIRRLEGLPLSIRSISATDAQLRSTSDATPFRDPANVVIQFESSPRWPDDLIAIQRVKIAFLIKLAELLESQGSDITTRIGTENRAIEIVNQSFLDVHYPDSASFRIRINADKERALIEKMLKDKAAAPQTRENAALALAECKRLYTAQPAHTTLVQKLCTTYPVLSPAITLTKKWFASHLLSSDFCDEAIELIVIRAFITPFPYPVPSSPKTAFLRSLDFLSTWDWRTEPLVLPNLGPEALTAPETASIHTRFQAWRNLDPAMTRVALYIASATERDGAVWTSSAGQTARPSKLLAGRMTALARAAMQTVSVAPLQGPLDLDFDALFTSPLSDYDFVVRFKDPFAGPAGSASGRKTKFKNLLVDPDSRDLGGAALAQLFVDELRAVYGSTVVFLYGGGPVIGGLWNPFVSARPWKVNLGYGTRPVLADGDEGEERVMAEVNREGILSEIARLGGDMIEKITVNKD